MANINQELKDLLIRIQPTMRLRKITVGLALVMAVGFITGRMGPPNLHQNLEIALILLIWLSSIFCLEFLIKKQKTASGVTHLYFGHEILELFLMTWIVYNMGGAEGIGAIFYLFIIVYGNIVLSKTKGLILSTIASFFYLSLVFLEYSGFLPFREFFPIEVSLYKDPVYLITTTPFILFAFYLIGLAASSFTDLLKKRTMELEKTKEALEEVKTILEVKVKARTHELEELAAKREEIVEEKTRELREKVEELERFHRLAVGRELKMMELKAEMEKLKEELEKIQKPKKVKKPNYVK